MQWRLRLCNVDFQQVPPASLTSAAIPSPPGRGSSPAVLSRKVTVLKALLGRETVAKVTTQQKGHTKVMDKGRSSGRQLREEEGFKKDYFDRKR